MKPFNLEEAKAGKPVITRDGRDVKILTFKRNNSNFPIVALVSDDSGHEDILSFMENGRFLRNSEYHNDLFMKEMKREGWVNIYQDDKYFYADLIFKTRGEAVSEGKKDCKYLTTTKITWEL